MGLCIIFAASFFGFNKYSNQGYQYQDVSEKLDELSFEDDNTLDVLFLGDSIAWAAYYPEQFWKTNGIASYNCSTTGQIVADGHLILKRTLDKHHPKVVVLDANSIYTRISRAKYTLAQYIPIFHYHFAYTENNNVSERDALRGFNAYNGTDPYSGNPQYMQEGSEEDPFGDFAADQLNGLYKTCREHDIALVITCTPNPYSWSRGKHNAVQNWCNANDVEFIDYNLLTEEIGIDWNADTRDGGEHLNTAGAIKISTHLSNYLREHYQMADHRGEEKYRLWDTDYGEAES